MQRWKRAEFSDLNPMLVCVPHCESKSSEVPPYLRCDTLEDAYVIMIRFYVLCEPPVVVQLGEDNNNDKRAKGRTIKITGN